MRGVRGILWGVILAALGCDDGDAPVASADTGPADVGVDRGLDEGPRLDASPDARPGDQGPSDGGPTDQAPPDQGRDAAVMSDMRPPDMAAPDMAEFDMAEFDMAELDMAAPDMAAPDMAAPDMAAPDMAAPDMAAPDMAAPDMAAPELAIDALAAWCNPQRGSVGLRAQGRLAQAPALRIRLGFRDGAGAVVPFDGGALTAEVDRFEARTDWAVADDGFTLSARRAVAAPLAQVAAVVLTVEDVDGQVAEAQAACAPPPVLAAGAAGCDDLDAWAVCPDGQGCDPAGRCRDALPPTLLAAGAALNEAGRSFGVAVEGRDADGDVTAAQVRLLRADGSPATPGALRVALQVQPDAQGFLARGGGRLPATVEAPGQVAAADVALVDETGLLSAPLRVAVRRPEALFAGQACDPLEAFDTCPAGDACVLPDGEPQARGVCGPVPDGCPEAWPAVAAEPDGAGGWVLEGALAAEGPRTAPASCTDGPAFAVGVFQAPAAGRYGFSLVEGPPGARVFARTACALPAPRFEVGCGADLQVFLAQDEVVWVWAAGAPGPFAVAAQREEGE